MHPIIHITDKISFPTYLVVLSLIYSVATIWIFRRSRKLSLSPQTAMDISIAIMVGGLIGARLLHVFFEHPDFYLKYPVEIFKIWNGGYVFYGGFVGAFASAYLVARIKKQDPLVWMDAFAPIIPVAYGLGRLGCFFAGCCYGFECDLPWAVKFPEALGSPPAGVLRHPTQIYDLLLSLVVFLTIYFVEKHRYKSFKFLALPGFLFFQWMILYGIQRVFIEDLRDDFRGPAIAGLTLSTLISFLFILMGTVWLVRAFIKSKNNQLKS